MGVNTGIHITKDAQLDTAVKYMWQESTLRYISFLSRKYDSLSKPCLSNSQCFRETKYMFEAGIFY